MSDGRQEMVEADALRVAPWRATYIVKPDLGLLATSLAAYGWLSPIVVYGKRDGDGLTVVDGHERLALAKAMPRVLVDRRFVPAVVLPDISETEAMIMHVTLNRGRGQVLNKSLSKIVRTIINSGTHDSDSLMRALNMTADELQVLLDGSLLKMRKISEHVYSKAWVPIEANQDERPHFERPPNPDR